MTKTIWNSDGTDGPCLITAPPKEDETRVYLSLCQHCCMAYHPNMLTGYLRQPGIPCEGPHGFRYCPGELAMVYFDKKPEWKE